MELFKSILFIYSLGNSDFVQYHLHSSPLLLREDFPRNPRFLPEPLVEGVASPADGTCPDDGYNHIGKKSSVEKAWCTVVQLVLLMLCLDRKAVGPVEAAVAICVNAHVNGGCREDKEPTKGPGKRRSGESSASEGLGDRR